MVFVRIFLFSLLALSAYGLPITAEHKDNKPPEKDQIQTNLEYERYLTEVINILESDKNFRKKIENATEEDIRTGKIAMELAYVDHHIRSKLDEAKRTEINRLRKLALKKMELSNHIDREHLRVPEHVDHGTDTFEIDDLAKLIAKASKDLTELDKQRREQFKQYEMQKEFEKQQQLNVLDDDSKHKFEDDIKKKEELHNKHEPVHYPGRKAQLEEVWEKQDHMDPEDFDPLKFFKTHDLDGNDVLDQLEVEALFQKELDKVYQSEHPEDDMVERAEEMERMREEVFREYDLNGDSLISLEEFLEVTKHQEFAQDREWETIDGHKQFTDEEYKKFEQQRQAEIERYIKEGKYSPEIEVPAGYHRKEYHPNVQPVQHHQQMGQQQHMGQPPQQMGAQQHIGQPPQQMGQYNQQMGQQYQQGGQQYPQGGQQYQQGGQQYQPNNQANQAHYNQINQGPPGGNVQYAPPNVQYHPNIQGQPQYQGNVQNLPPNAQYIPNIAPNQGQYNPQYVPVNNQNPPGNQPNAPQGNAQLPNSGQYNSNIQGNQQQYNGNTQQNSQNSGNQPNQIGNQQNSGYKSNQPNQNPPNANHPNSVNDKNTAQKQP